MSRRRSEEPAFNSDSFLDIVCNLVGIMIILIIVAGLRVSRAPVSPVDSEPAPAAPQAIVQNEPEVQVGPQLAGIKTAELADWLELAPDAPAIAAEETALPAVEQPPTDLISQAEELKNRMAESARRNAELLAREASARQNLTATEQQLNSLATQLESTTTQAQATRLSAEAAALVVQELETQAAQLASEVSALAQQPADAQVLKHSVTPISRQVSGRDELHFRLSGDRVSVVPLDSLAQALKLRMDRSRDLFLRVNRYEGAAGPVDGFLMRYVIEKQRPSAIEELRNGGPFIRIQLAYYELDVGPDVVTESAEQALTPGSRFLTALTSARPGTPLTFWVYPDSFDIHRQLLEYAHEARFDVAARPLPIGVPIAGSPNGSRSAAQ